MADSDHLFADLPSVLEAEFVMDSLNAPIPLASGNFRLLANGVLLGVIDGVIRQRWLPRPAIEVDGILETTAGQKIPTDSLVLEIPQLETSCEFLITKKDLFGARRNVRGVLHGVERMPPAVERLRFYLVRFPDYVGRPTKYSTPHGAGGQTSRLTMQAKGFRCDIDSIDQVGPLSEQASLEPGYVISHVGELTSISGPVDPKRANDMLSLLYWLLAFMRGARTGPILPSVGTPFAQGWVQLTPWSLDEPGDTQSWLPLHHMGDFDGLFGGFQDLWVDPEWNEPLRNGIAWYLAANSSNTYSAVRIPLVQIALEMFSWVHLVNKGGLSAADFKKIPAEDRIRKLLELLHVPSAVPARLEELHAYSTRCEFDGVKCLTFLRNKLSHPTAGNNKQLQGIDGIVYMQAAQLGLEFFELALLCLCRYQGHYARRAFRGWKGNDEIAVPWQTC